MTVELEAIPSRVPPALMRPPEVAEYLGISRSKTYAMLAAGSLPGVVRIGASVRVHRPTLEAWLEALARREP
jgi:excisionase family DNA binding protein